MTICISIGSNCATQANIQKYTETTETNFFDWTYEDFGCVLSVLENIDNPENILNPNDFLYINNYIVSKKIKLLSAHDKPENESFESYLPTFIEKYTRRLARLKEVIKNNNKIVFIHYISPESLNSYKLFKEISDIPNETQINTFFNLIKNINNDCTCYLYLAIPPTLQEHYYKLKLVENMNNVFTHYFRIINEIESWTMKHYDWNIIFDKIKEL